MPFRIAVVVVFLVLGVPAVARAQERPYEPNDTQATAAGPLLSSTTYGAAIDEPPQLDQGNTNARNEDVDWYVFHTVGAGPVEVAFVFDAAKGGCFGPEVRLRDATGMELDREHPFIDQLVHLNTTASGPATYYVEVAAYAIEPCPPNDSPYRLLVKTPLVALAGEQPLVPAAGAPPQAAAPPQAGAAARSSPKLLLTRARLTRGVLRLRGTLAAGASLRLLEGSAYGRVGTRTFSFGFKAMRGKAGTWTTTRLLPQSLRHAKSIRVLLSYAGDARFKPVRLRTRTVRASR